MKKITMILLIGLALLFVGLTGCSSEKKEVPLDINKVTFLYYSGDYRTIVMYVFTSDYHVDKYLINPKENSQLDLLGGELPAKDEYTIHQYEITESNWIDVVNVLSKVNFMELEEELPHGEVCDAPSFYIQVETADAIHKSGGYNAGEEKDDANKRFKAVREIFKTVLK